MRKRNKGKFNIVVALSLVAILAGTVLGFSADVSVSQALFDSDTCTTFAAYSASHTIPDGTIFYGTYLVNIRTLNDQIYAKAQSSATESGQSNMYYKSELGGSQWYDITSVSDISDISTLGTPISASEINGLYVKYYIGSDGVVKNALTDATSNLFNDPEPYYKPNMTEFEDFFNLYESETYDAEDIEDIEDYITNDGPGDAATYSQEALAELGNTDWVNEGDAEKKIKKYRMQEAMYDLQLANLYSTYILFTGSWQDGNGDGLDAERAEVLYEIMESVDAQRRINYFSFFLDDSTDTGYDSIRQAIEAADSYQAQEAWGTVEENIFTSISNYEQKTVEDPGTDGTLLEQRKYSTYSSILDAALNGTLTNNYELVFNYSDYSHIQNAVVASRDREISKLDNDLVPNAIARYKTYLTAGVSSDYTAALSSGGTEDTLTSYLTAQADALETYVGEAENYIEARELRDTAVNNEAYIVERVREANEFYSSIKDDAFATKAKASLAAYIKWLSGELQDVEEDKASSDEETDTTSLSALESQKEALEEEYLEKVQKNDLDGAESIMAEIALLDEQIAAAEEELAKKAAAGDQVAAAQLSNSNTVNGLVESLKDTAIEDITNENSDSNAINTLIAIGADDAIDELTEMFGEDNETLSLAILSAKNTYNTNATATDKKNRLASNLTTKTASTSSSDEEEEESESDSDSGTGAGTSSSGNGTGSDNSSSKSSASSTGSSKSSSSSTDTGKSESETTSSSTGTSNGSASAGTSGNKDTTGLGSNEAGEEAAEALVGLTEDEIEEVLDEAMEDAVGDSLEDADTESKVAALVALQAMDDGSNKNTEKVRDALLTELLSDSYADDYIYSTYTDSKDTVFVSLKAISAITDFRYIFDKKHSLAYMRQESPSKTYTFKVNSNSVSITGVSDTSSMDKNAVMKTDRGSNWLYICQSAAENYFDIVGVPITDKDYSIAMTTDVYTAEKDILEAISNQ